VDGDVGLGGYHTNITSVYLFVRLTGHPILCGWCRKIRWIPSKYSFGVSIGPPDSPSNIMWMILLD
jgi:hypothetical protein